MAGSEKSRGDQLVCAIMRLPEKQQEQVEKVITSLVELSFLAQTPATQQHLKTQAEARQSLQ